MGLEAKVICNLLAGWLAVVLQKFINQVTIWFKLAIANLSRNIIIKQVYNAGRHGGERHNIHIKYILVKKSTYIERL